MHSEHSEHSEPSVSVPPRSGGLYSRVRLSARGASILVAVSALLLVAVTAYGIAHNGYTVTFRTNGGSPVESVRAYYAQEFPFPAPPTRPGFRFTGWFLDADCRETFDPSQTPVTGSTTLYAGWEPCIAAGAATADPTPSQTDRTDDSRSKKQK